MDSYKITTSSVTVTNWAQRSKATSAFAMEPMGFLFMASCTRISVKPGQHGAVPGGPLLTPPRGATLLLTSPWEVYHLAT